MISALTLASRILGLARDMACSYAFGLGGVWSAFVIAFQIPNLFRRLFGEGALSAASIPVLTDTLTRHGAEATAQLAGRLVGLLFAALTALCLVTELVVLGLYWNYRDTTTTSLMLVLTALTMPYMVLICTAAILGSIQNVFGRFAVPAAVPIVLNVCMIVAALLGPRLFAGQMNRAVVLLAGSVIVAGILQLGWQWRALQRSGMRLRLRLEIHDPDLRQIGLTMLPMVAGLAAVQVNTVVDQFIAYWFVRETVSIGSEAQRVGPAVLYYAQRLYQFPLGVFAIAIATAIFPTLSRQASENDIPALTQTLARGVRLATFEALPCLVGLILVARPLVIVLYGRGEFKAWPEGVDRVALTLILYALGIWAYSLNHLFARAFYAMHDARTPLRVSVAMVGLNLVLNLCLVRTPLKEAGLALATSICAILQSAALIMLFSRRAGRLGWSGIAPSLARTVAATVLMAAAILVLDRMALHDTRSFVRLVVLVAAGAVTYPAAALLLGSEELHTLRRRRIARSAPEGDDSGT